MSNDKLNAAILRNLAQVEFGLRERVLRYAVEINLNRPDIHTDDFELALGELKNGSLIHSWNDLLGRRVWGITDEGRVALKGL